MAFPKSDYSEIYTSVLAILKTDPILKREVKDWQMFDGTEKLRQTNSRNLPSLTLFPEFRESNWGTNQQGKMTMVIDVLGSCNGTDAGQGLDFLSAVHRALFPLDAERKQQVDRIASPKITRLDFTEPRFQQPDTANIITYRATIELTIFVPRK